MASLSRDYGLNTRIRFCACAAGAGMEVISLSKMMRLTLPKSLSEMGCCAAAMAAMLALCPLSGVQAQEATPPPQGVSRGENFSAKPPAAAVCLRLHRGGLPQGSAGARQEGQRDRRALRLPARALHQQPRKRGGARELPDQAAERSGAEGAQGGAQPASRASPRPRRHRPRARRTGSRARRARASHRRTSRASRRKQPTRRPAAARTRRPSPSQVRSRMPRRSGRSSRRRSPASTRRPSLPSSLRNRAAKPAEPAAKPEPPVRPARATRGRHPAAAANAAAPAAMPEPEPAPAPSPPPAPKQYDIFD